MSTSIVRERLEPLEESTRRLSRTLKDAIYDRNYYSKQHRKYTSKRNNDYVTRKEFKKSMNKIKGMLLNDALVKYSSTKITSDRQNLGTATFDSCKHSRSSDKGKNNAETNELDPYDSYSGSRRSRIERSLGYECSRCSFRPSSLNPECYSTYKAHKDSRIYNVSNSNGQLGSTNSYSTSNSTKNSSVSDLGSSSKVSSQVPSQFDSVYDYTDSQLLESQSDCQDRVDSFEMPKPAIYKPHTDSLGPDINRYKRHKDHRQENQHKNKKTSVKDIKGKRPDLKHEEIYTKSHKSLSHSNDKSCKVKVSPNDIAKSFVAGSDLSESELRRIYRRSKKYIRTKSPNKATQTEETSFIRPSVVLENNNIVDLSNPEHIKKLNEKRSIAESNGHYDSVVFSPQSHSLLRKPVEINTTITFDSDSSEYYSDDTDYYVPYGGHLNLPLVLPNRLVTESDEEMGMINFDDAEIMRESESNGIRKSLFSHDSSHDEIIADNNAFEPMVVFKKDKYNDEIQDSSSHREETQSDQDSSSSSEKRGRSSLDDKRPFSLISDQKPTSIISDMALKSNHIASVQDTKYYENQSSGDPIVDDKEIIQDHTNNDVQYGSSSSSLDTQNSDGMNSFDMKRCDLDSSTPKEDDFKDSSDLDISLPQLPQVNRSDNNIYDEDFQRQADGDVTIEHGISSRLEDDEIKENLGNLDNEFSNIERHGKDPNSFISFNKDDPAPVYDPSSNDGGA